MATTMDAGLSPERGSPDRSPLGLQAHGRRAGGIAVRPPRAAQRPLAGGLWLLLAWLLAAPGRAQQPPLAPNGLHGGRHVGLAEPPEESLRVAGSLGYGFTEEVLGDADS